MVQAFPTLTHSSELTDQVRGVIENRQDAVAGKCAGLPMNSTHHQELMGSEALLRGVQTALKELQSVGPVLAKLYGCS